MTPQANPLKAVRRDREDAQVRTVLDGGGGVVILGGGHDLADSVRRMGRRTHNAAASA
jgi:hypothetical protein